MKRNNASKTAFLQGITQHSSKSKYYIMGYFMGFFILGYDALFFVSIKSISMSRLKLIWKFNFKVYALVVSSKYKRMWFLKIL